MPEGLVERYDERIAAVLSCYGRIVITGTMPGICYAKGMTPFLYANGTRIFMIGITDRLADAIAFLLRSSL
jgi:hypothetical protein